MTGVRHRWQDVSAPDETATLFREVDLDATSMSDRIYEMHCRPRPYGQADHACVVLMHTPDGWRGQTIADASEAPACIDVVDLAGVPHVLAGDREYRSGWMQSIALDRWDAAGHEMVHVYIPAVQSYGNLGPVPALGISAPRRRTSRGPTARNGDMPAMESG